MRWLSPGAKILLASLGLVVAASGGIGGGGILVPLFMLALDAIDGFVGADSMGIYGSLGIFDWNIGLVWDNDG